MLGGADEFTCDHVPRLSWAGRSRSRELAEDLFYECRAGGHPIDRNAVWHLSFDPLVLLQFVSCERLTGAFDPHDLGLDADDTVALALDGRLDAAARRAPDRTSAASLVRHRSAAPRAPERLRRIAG